MKEVKIFSEKEFLKLVNKKMFGIIKIGKGVITLHFNHFIYLLNAVIFKDLLCIFN